MQALRLVATLTLVVLLSACASKGVGALKNETSESVEAKFVVGVTEKSTILDALGRPTNTTFTDSGLEVLTYAYRELTPRARNFIPYNIFSQVNDSTTKELVMLFDKQGVLERLVFNETETEERWGVVE
ncbi:MAG: hypothetical protein AAGC71_12395 [Pseudomonadota bacterium]